MPEKPTLAVIGLGASALVTLKTLAEKGFNVTVFERSSSIGGFWGYEDTTTKTTVLKIQRITRKGLLGSKST
ncbi:hypothetical protein BJX68DRAFT_249635 [Aspergillus pseudodeflectus]|uniref:Uncharacterized protein n=1 Tax=Aspergillus pseudodeflectus TaxID=176178 RepID=A0ABR4JC70_9EURO